jgi:cation-transporting ATPase E
MKVPSPPLPLTGLSPAEVAERIARGLVNRVRRSDRAEYVDIVRRNVLTLFNALVVPAAIALFLLRDPRAAVAVSGMALANTFLGLFQEVRAKRHLDKLTLLAETRARVKRDGQVVEVPSGDVVLGDLILLAAGDSVVADGEVLEARFLEVDEALLTGESDPVVRKPGDNLLSGSFCVAGEGVYRADKVGAAAFAQRTASEARSYRYTASPLQDSLNRLIRILTAIAITLCAGYVALYYLRGNFSADELVRMIAATITLMVPQGLVLMSTLAFILGAVRMSARGAVVQRLNAVEAMASIDTLCMDKTGTLTTNQLHLAEVRVLAEDLGVEGARTRLRLFASLSLDRTSKSLAAVRAALGEVEGKLLDQLPFKSQNRYSAVRVLHGGQEHRLVLGACEALKPFLRPQDEDGWERGWKELLGSGLRLLLFAEVAGGGERAFGGSLEGFALRPLALLGLSDELRPEAAGVLQALAEQGIGFKILSGDNPETVRATVAPLGAGSDAPALRALGEQPVVSGAELEAVEEPGEVIRGRSVFGRVSPWQKVQIVTTLKAQGRQVAMVGDGVNDVLPIKNANLGIAMGDGAPASKTVAGLVLETNDFGLLPETLDEGRTIVRNLRGAGKLFLVKNVYVPFLIVLGLGVFNLRFPLEPQQVTLLNFLTIGVPALLITLGRERSRVLRGDYVREVGAFVLRSGVIIGMAGLVVMLLSARVWGDDPWTQRTMLLSALIFLGIGNLLRALTDGEVGMLPGDWPLRWWAAAALPIYLAVLYVPGFALGSRLVKSPAWFFELAPLTLAQWGRVLLVVVPASVAVWASDRWWRRQREASS